MGAVHYSIDTKLLEQFKDLLPLTTFVETGTFDGDSVQSALPLFRELYSVESVEERYKANTRRFAGKESVRLHHGDSAHFLKQLQPKLRDVSALYWLDAHWCDSNDSNEPGENQCPLPRELDAIESLNDQSVILIDDARYFLAPPPEPHDPSQWPLLGEVFEKLRAISTDHEIAVCNDVIIFSPKRIGTPLRACLQRNQVDWLAVINRAADRDRQLREANDLLRKSDAEHSVRAATMQALREGLQLCEVDLRTSEADRANRLETIRTLQEQLQISEADRANRLNTIEVLQEQLQISEADRADRLKNIQTLQEQLQTSEADRAERLNVIHTLQEQLQTSEDDRAKRLDVIHALQEQLRASEDDRAERLDFVQKLQDQLRTNQAHRAELLTLLRTLQDTPAEQRANEAAISEKDSG